MFPFLSSSYPHYPLKEKRKRVDELLQRVPKRLRSAESAADVGHSSHQDVLGSSSVHPAEKQPRCSKLSRTRRLKQQRASQQSLDEPNIMKSCDPLQRSNACLIQNSLTCAFIPFKLQEMYFFFSSFFCLDLFFEDTLWTDKYSPQHSSEVIGNPASVNKLYR